MVGQIHAVLFIGPFRDGVGLGGGIGIDINIVDLRAVRTVAVGTVLDPFSEIVERCTNILGGVDNGKFLIGVTIADGLAVGLGVEIAENKYRRFAALLIVGNTRQNLLDAKDTRPVADVIQMVIIHPKRLRFTVKAQHNSLRHTGTIALLLKAGGGDVRCGGEPKEV